MIADLKNKVVLITGGSGILGKTFVENFIEHEMRVVIVDKNKSDLDQLNDNLLTKYPKANILTIHSDITDVSCISSMVTEALKCFGEINILINNAATKTENIKKFFNTYESYALETWKEVMSVNVDAMFLVSQAVGKVMVKQDLGGSIVQMSSIYGVIAPDERIYVGSEYMGVSINTPAVYAASKAAVIGLTRYLAIYWAKNKIRVNCISPGGIESGQNEVFKKKYSDRVPLGRMGKSSELAKMVLFLASEASSYITGQNMIVDGGLSVW